MATISFVEQEAIRNLLCLGDQKDDSFSPSSKNQRPILKEIKDPQKKANIFKSSATKSNRKVITQANSLQNSLATTQIKQNLKVILRKLQESPSPSKNKKNAKKGFDFHTIDSLSLNNQLKYKYSFQKMKEKNKKQIQQLLIKYKSKDMIQKIVNQRIIQKIKNIENRKTDNKRGYEKRQKALKLQTEHERASSKPKCISLRDRNFQKANYFKLCVQENNINRFMNRKNSHITLSQLLF